eukprot:CAMPEP_0172583742 /NCGR_PEP_ID=MMETSP1068-20121228/3303_1 /TAXON_ID=35684 /ORGANISM="Pseudopedinella elastica, Strain CCMP716" /LENGTH=321 /DNA_ID=CAMNT_0013377639 /DNA_START=303 /DNA_END=1265 /DNA_ORIENTATION=-
MMPRTLCFTTRVRSRPSKHSFQAHFLDHIEDGPDDPILGLVSTFNECKSDKKVNLIVGAYRDAEGKPWVLPSVREAEERMASAPGANKEYSAIDGDPEFVSKALAFAYGAESEALASGRVAGVQTLSGTGACRIGGEFYARFAGAGTPVYLSDPTWGNHVGIMKAAGLEVRRYRYFDGESKGLDFAGMCEDLEAAPEGSVVLLHACAHNPTGVDPTPEQWAKVADLCARRGLHVFFDSAYQGFASGDADADGSAFRSFVARAGDFPSMCLAQSFAKNFGLYGERVGTFSVVCGDSGQAAKVLSQLKLIIRPMYSSPPIHGA